MKCFRIFSFLTVFLLLGTSLLAQSEYDVYLQNAEQRLREGNCESAQKNYSVYKDMTGQTNADLQKRIDECKNPPVKTTNTENSQHTNGTTYNISGMEMVFVEGGTFFGCIPEQNCDCEKAIGKSITQSNIAVNDFYIGKYEVTQAQWKQVMGTSVREKRNEVRQYMSTIRDVESSEYPIVGEGDNYPMYLVNREDVEEFILRLNMATGKKFRLPTAAEWEYAEQGGNKSQGYKYSGSNNLYNVAWFADNSGGQTRPVGTKLSNELGIYDMSGNVMEWTTIYPFGSYYNSDMNGCKLQDCWRLSPNYYTLIVGFRLACSVD